MPADAAAPSPSKIDPQQRIDELSSMLRESESRLALVTDAVAEGIYEWNIETNALWQSQRLTKIFGLEGRELKAADWNELVHFEDFERYRSALRDCFKGIAGRLDCEYRVKHADGSYRWLEDRAVPVRNAAGLAVRLVGAVTDVTGRKESEYALREALEQQTATAEVLQVINSSPGNLTPVFEAMLEKAMRLCEANFGGLTSYDGERFHTLALRGLGPEVADAFREPWKAGPGSYHENLVMGERLVHADFAANDAARRAQPQSRVLAEIGGARSGLLIALRKDDALLGSLWFYRTEVRPFSNKQIALLQNFADQAVVAMENARLLSELRERTDDLTESLEYQTAISEVLEVIGRSTSDLTPVLDTMLAAAARLCGVQKGDVCIRQGDAFRCVTSLGPTPEELAWLQRRVLTPGRATTPARALMERQVVQVLDQSLDRENVIPDEVKRPQTVLAVPLLREGEPIGVITLVRGRVEAFSERQVALIRTFADQAVIAMENARLLGELREALDQQTANAEVLQAINASPGNLRPVFEAILEKAMQVCHASFGGFWTFEADRYVAAALYNLPQAYGEFLSTTTLVPGPGTAPHRFLHGERSIIQDIDLAAEEPYRAGDPQRRALVELGGARTALHVPLCTDDAVFGVVTIYRQEVQAFDERQIALLQSFAAQAVIAIQNARLLSELRDRQAELRVTFDNMGDGVAMFDDNHRLGAWNRNFEQIMSLSEDWLVRRPAYAEYLELLAERGEFGTENVEAELASRLEDTERELRLERTRADGSVIEVRRNAVPGGGFVLIYSDITERRRAEAAIRAARDAAEVALEQQTATAEILKVIANSPNDVQPVFDVVVKAAVRLCGAQDSVVVMRDGLEVVFEAHEGPLGSDRGSRWPLDGENVMGRAIIEGRTIHVADASALGPGEFTGTQQGVVRYGFKAIVAAPLMREGSAIGALLLRKQEPGPFTQRQMELLETFAAQAVIAIENVRLFTELKDSLERLKAAQANLIQAEKMASLGQLTAGIAHEIKNPLNFVNNFSGLSVELLDELKETAAPVLAGMNADTRAEFVETVELLTSNLEKIAEHGKRADGIVKSMLSHSRGGKGDWQESNINALVEEALNLAYHGARAQDQDFNVTLERDFAPEAKLIEVVPQDVTRVFLNLFGNGFYATRKRHLGGVDAGYRPTLTVSTRDLGKAVEVRVRDNGTGIQPEVRAKLFQPFFTTKPTGEGTGLGLSISYDIVTQQHGGTIEVESEVGQYTEFTVRLPRARRAAATAGGE